MFGERISVNYGCVATIISMSFTPVKGLVHSFAELVFAPFSENDLIPGGFCSTDT
jgi:hypothetical protein